MKIKEYMEQLKIIQENIKDCDNLIELYRTKKQALQVEYEKLLNKEVKNDK